MIVSGESLPMVILVTVILFTLMRDCHHCRVGG